jgi:hypothetical protein
VEHAGVILHQVRKIIRIDDGLLQQAWYEARRRGVSLGSLIEQGLQLVLHLPNNSSSPRALDLPIRQTTDSTQAQLDL